jgi:ubiquinone biosynthesis protein
LAVFYWYYGNGKPYWIDFGMMGRVSNKDIDNIQNMIMALINGDADGLVNTLTTMGGMTADTNREKLIQDAQIFMDRFSTATSISNIDVSAMFNDVMDLANKHHVKLPGEYTMLGRALIAIEGVIEQLCPELNLFDILSDKLTERIKNNFDLKATLLDAGKGLLGVGKKAANIPGLIAETLSALAKGRIKVGIEITGIEEPLQKIGDFTLNVMLILIACVILIGGCMLSSVNIEPKVEGGMPLLADIMLVFSIALAIYAVKKLANRNKK